MGLKWVLRLIVAIVVLFFVGIAARAIAFDLLPLRMTRVHVEFYGWSYDARPADEIEAEIRQALKNALYPHGSYRIFLERGFVKVDGPEVH